MSFLVSVIIPVYNSEKFLYRSVVSVLEQSYKNIELILVNDGSTDSSGKICDEFAQSDLRVKVIHQENKGVSVARNTAIKEANGDYITFLDSDDELFNDAIANLMNAATSSEADMAVGKLVNKTNTGKILEEDMDLSDSLLINERFIELALEDHPSSYYACRILYKKEFIRGLFFEENCIIGEDNFFVFQCATKKPKVVIIPNEVYIYYSNPTSATRSAFTDLKYDTTLRVLNKKLDIIERDFPHLKAKSYNMKVKTNMMLLENLCRISGNKWRKAEKKAINEINTYKRYFVPATKKNKLWYFIITNHLYFLFKVFFKLKLKLIK